MIAQTRLIGQKHLTHNELMEEAVQKLNEQIREKRRRHKRK